MKNYFITRATRGNTCSRQKYIHVYTCAPTYMHGGGILWYHTHTVTTKHFPYVQRCLDSFPSHEQFEFLEQISNCINNVMHSVNFTCKCKWLSSHPTMTKTREIDEHDPTRIIFFEIAHILRLVSHSTLRFSKNIRVFQVNFKIDW